jgi:hypothetical protein
MNRGTLASARLDQPEVRRGINPQKARPAGSKRGPDAGAERGERSGAACHGVCQPVIGKGVADVDLDARAHFPKRRRVTDEHADALAALEQLGDDAAPQRTGRARNENRPSAHRRALRVAPTSI